MSPVQTLSCWHCGAEHSAVSMPLSRHEFCRACGEALHTCRQCRFHDLRQGCSESRAEPPTNPESANFCEWFTPRLENSVAMDARSAAADSARARLEALFAPPADDSER